MNLAEPVKPSIPELSVILLVDKQRQRGTECLQALLSQSIIKQIEIVLLDFSDLAPLPGSDHPSVNTVRMQDGVTFGTARAAGVKCARGPVVAFVEEHVQVLPGWAEAVVTAHREPYAAIGGEVHNGNPGEGVSDAIAMMNYYRWLPPAKHHEATLLDGHNSTYKRDALLKFGDDLGWWLDCEAVLHTQLLQNGEKLLCDPAIKYKHINEHDMRIAYGYFLFNRVMAAYRHQMGTHSLIQLALGAWLLPLVRTYRTIVEIKQSYPQHLSLAVRSIPFMLVSQSFSAAGQLVGALFGVGKASEEFRSYEMNVKRRRIDNVE